MTGGLDDVVKLWEWSGSQSDGELKLQHTLDGHALGVISVDVNHTSTLAASSSLDSTIRLWNLHNGQQVTFLSEFYYDLIVHYLSLSLLILDKCY